MHTALGGGGGGGGGGGEGRGENVRITIILYCKLKINNFTTCNLYNISAVIKGRSLPLTL